MTTTETTLTTTEATTPAVAPKPKAKRIIFGWEPCGPIRAMLNNESRSKRDRTKIIEDGLAEAYGKKYPKLLARYRTISKSTTV